MRKVTLLFCCLFGKDVALVCVLSLDLSGAGKLEAFLGSGVGLHFLALRRILILVLEIQFDEAGITRASYFFFLGIGAR